MRSICSLRFFSAGLLIGLASASFVGCDGPDAVVCDLPQRDPVPVALSANFGATFARFSDGSVYCWGQDAGACGFSYWASPVKGADCLSTLFTNYAGVGLGPGGRFTVWNFHPAIPFDDFMHEGTLSFSRAPTAMVTSGASLWVLDEHGTVWTIGRRLNSAVPNDFTNVAHWTPLAAPVPMAKLEQPGCAIGTDENLYCSDGLWLYDYRESIEVTVDFHRVALPEKVRGWARAGVLTCVLGVSGTLRCLGSNYSELLGVPDTELEGSATFRPIENLPPLARFTLTNGAANLCGQTTDGRLLCWGENGYSKLVEDPALDFYDIPEPTEVGQQFWGDILDFTINDDSLCILRASDSTIWCRGFVGTGHCDLERGWREVSYEPCEP